MDRTTRNAMTRFSITLGIVLAAALIADAPARAAGPALKKWTVMVFLNADNDLDKYGVLDVREMERTPSTPDVGLLVQIDRAKLPCRRYDVMDRAANAASDDWGFNSRRTADLGEVDMGDPRELVKFVQWAAASRPAENYLLVLWNHGSGWRRSREATKGISYDDQSGNHMTTPQLASALAQIRGVLGKPVDVLGFDACLMQMLEVAYEVRESARYMVGSEESEPGEGWPYDRIFPPLAADPGMDAAALAKMIPQAYASSYTKPATLSALDLERVEEMAEAASDFADALAAAVASSAVEVAAARDCLDRVQKFSNRDYIDLARLMELVRERTANGALRAAAERGLAAHGRTVVGNCVSGSTPTWTLHCYGLSVFFPLDQFPESYSTIRFSALRWDEMARAVIAALAAARRG